MKGTTKKMLWISSILIIFSAVVALAGTNTYDYTILWSDSAGNPVNNIHALNYQCADANCATLGNLDQEIFSGSSNSVAINYSVPSPANGYGTYWFASCYRPMEMAWKPSGAGSYAENATFLKYANCLSNTTDLTANLVLNQPSIITASINPPTISGLNTPPLAEPSSQSIKDNFYSLSTKVDLTIKNGANVIYTDSKTVPIHRDEKSTVQFTWTPTVYGTYTITVSSASVDCKCSSNAISTKSITAKINVPPTAKAGGPYAGSEGSAIILDASGSSDSDGTIVKYEWDLNNDSVYEISVTTPKTTNTWNDDFSGIIKLRVTDNDGATATDTASVTVNNVPPTANANGPYIGNEGQLIQFTGSQTDPGADTFTYLWSFGDGATSTLKNPTHAYADNGVYAVTLTVTDDDGGVGVANTTATIANVAPTASASNNGPKPEGAAVTVTASQTDPGILDTFVYSFDWNNDGVYEIVDQAGNSAQNTWYDNGNYIVRVRVKDKDGGIGIANTNVTITNVAPTVHVTGPSSAKNNTNILFNGTFTDPGVLDTWTCSWNFGDGTSTAFAACTSPVGASHTYTVLGNYTVTLIVKDDDGGVGNDTMKISIVPRTPPVANPNGPYSGEEGSPVTLNGSGSYDPEGMPIISYQWDTNNDGIYNDASGVNPQYTWLDDYNNKVCLKVITSDGATGTGCTTANIANVAPVANANGPYVGNEGQQIQFNCSQTDPGADTFTYLWKFGDGSTSTLKNPTHAYADNGVYNATCNVTDDDGGSGSDTTTATIANIAPTVNVGPDRTGKINKAVQFNGTFVDPGALDTWTCAWNFGDGATSNNACTSPTSAMHTYNALGNYTVTLTVTDKDGGSGSDSLIIAIVTTDPPFAEANGPYAGNESQNIQFNSSGSHAVEPGAIITSYFWDFGDGTNSTQQNPTHAYGDNGVYTATLTVTDSFSKSASDTSNATIANLNPTCDAGPVKSGNEGSAVTFSGTASDVPADQPTLSYSWTFGDGTNASGTLTPSHTYVDNGNYVVTLIVRDKDGGQCNDTTNANISNVAPVVDAGPNRGVEVFREISITGIFTDPGADTWTCKWDFGDGTNTSFSACASPVTKTHIYTAVGNYTATLTVMDDDNGIGNDSLIVNVVPVAGTLVYINPPYLRMDANKNFSIDVGISTTDNIFAAQLDLYFNNSLLAATCDGIWVGSNAPCVVGGNFLKQDGAVTFPVITVNNSIGKISFGSSRFGVTTGVTGTGVLATINFTTKTTGTSALDLNNVIPADPSLNGVATNTTDGRIDVGIPGDANLDGLVNVFDLATVGKAFGTSATEDRFNPKADVHYDRKINIFDLATVGANFGRRA